MSGWSDKDGLDDFGRRVKKLIEEVVPEFGEAVVWRMERQTVENPHPTIVVTARGADREFSVPREDEPHITDEQIRELLRGHVRLALYG